jgi:replicative DNA helicase
MPDTFDIQKDAALEKLVDDEAEMHLLGNVLREPKCFDACAWMKPDFFGRQTNGKIWDAIKSLRSEGRPFGPEYLTEFFKDEPWVKINGGDQYLKMLVMNSFATSSVKDLASHLLSLHYRRMLLSLGNDAREIALDPEFYNPPEKVLADFELILAEARGLKTHDNAVDASMTASSALIAAKNPQQGIKFGLEWLDKITKGSKPAQLIVLGGRPGMGKTAAGLTFAVNAANAGKKVLFFSLEMSRDELMQRVFSRLSRQAVHSGEVRDHEALERAAEEAAKLPLFIDDAAGITALDIAARASTFQRKNGLDLVVIDYLGLIKATDTRAQKVHQVEEVTQALKGLAKSLKIPVLLLCQLSRPQKGDERKRPGLSDLRDSGAIEQDADVVMFVYREEYYAQKDAEQEHANPNRQAAALADAEAVKNNAEIIVAKQRQGILDTVFCKFSGERQYFHD